MTKERHEAAVRVREICAVIDRFADDVESGEIFPDGVVVTPVEDDDSLVRHLDEFTMRRAVARR